MSVVDWKRTLRCAGHIRPPVYPFRQKTGRNSPKPKEGFLLNLPSWMRSLIRPKPGHVFVQADWSQQEIAIAAALSGDERLLAAYHNVDGDVYLTLAKMAGAVPTDATKTSHPVERQTFKAVQLGLGYGKGIESLGVDVYESNRDADGNPILSHQEAEATAEAIYDWHQETFVQYWDWIWQTIERARCDGYVRSLDGWTYFVDDSVRSTQLLNFPMQANGAAMMRRATIRCWATETLDVVCTHHDALYINCREEERDQAIETLVRCMDQACHDILGDRVRIPVDIQVYDADTGYSDGRGAETLKAIRDLLGECW
jgi:DNA polymerase-1